MIIVLAAMQEELDAIVCYVDHPIKKNTPFGELIEGSIHGHSVVCAQTGVGKAVAAATTTYLLEHYDVSSIINIGSAGGLSLDLSIGDVIIADKVTYHDWDLSAFGYPVGWDNASYVFEMDRQLIKIAQEATKNLEGKSWVGPIVSGDQFISEKDQFSQIINTFPGALAVEMEAAAVGHVASLYQVPCAILRGISDVVLQDDSHIDFDLYIKKAAAQSAAAVVSTVELLERP